jgi:hypothetical protein
MKKILYLIAFLAFGFSYAVFSQAKKPELMVVPGDNWCISNNYYSVYDNLGSQIKIPDYQKALQEDPQLGMVISKINQLYSDRGFNLKNLETTLKNLQSQSTEDAMLTSKTGAGLNESAIDKLKQIAKADIIIQLNWTINQTGPKKSISFRLDGLDAYTDKQIAGASGTGQPSFSAEIPVLLEEAVLAHIDNFNAQLQRYFDDLFTNGREIRLRIKTFSSFDGDLESEFNGKELSEIIEDWVYQNTVKNRFSTTDATENMILFDQVRIPMYDNNNRALDARSWTRGLQSMLKDNYKITSKLMTKGLGQAQLVIGEK